MHPDLIARTCGSIGVLGALVFVGVLDTPKFIITPSQNFESVLLSINVAPKEKTISKEEALSEPITDQEPIVDNIAPTTEPIQEQKPIRATEPPITKEIPTEVIKVDEQFVKEEPKVNQKPIEKEQPKVEPNKINQPVKAEQKQKEIAKPKNKDTHINKAKAQRKSDQKVQAKQDKTIAEQKSIAEAANRKLNAQLASLLVKEIKSKLRYPRNAVRRKLEGTVMVEFVIQNGVVVSYTIEKSSGHKILDEAAGKLAKSLIKFNTRLDAMSNRVLIPIKYELL